MRFRYLVTLLVLSFQLAFFGCVESSSNVKKIKTTYNINNEITLAIQLKPNANPSISFQNAGGDQALRMDFSDRNCTNGHRISVDYNKNEKDILTIYPDKPFLWGVANTIHLVKKNQILIISFNDQTFEITPKRMPSKVIIPSKYADDIKIVK